MEQDDWPLWFTVAACVAGLALSRVGAVETGRAIGGIGAAVFAGWLVAELVDTWRKG